MNKTLPRGAVLGLIVAAGLVVFAAGWLLAVRPLAHKASQLRDQKAAVYRQIAENVAQSAPATAVSAPKIRTADVYKLSTAMPSTVDMPDLLLELQQTASAAGVQLQSISPTAPVAGPGGYARETVTLAVAGDFYGVTDLLYRLRNLVYVRAGALHANGRLFSVQSVTLSPAGTAAKNLLSASIAVDTYVYGTAAAAAPAPAPTGTATTTTTTTTTTTSGPTAAGATP